MRKFAFAYLFCSLLSGVSVAASAAAETPAQSATPQSVQPVQAAAAAQSGMVNLNTADEATLERELIGVGAVKAKAIVEYRAANGPFNTVDELLEVKGIGAATLDKNRARLSIN